jgi:hypothetical protein
MLESPLPHEILSQLYSNMLKARLLAKRWRHAQPTSEAVLAATLANVESEDVLVSAESHPILRVLSGAAIESSAPEPARALEQEADPNARLIIAGREASSGVAVGMAWSLKRAQSRALVVAVLPGKLTRGSAWREATELAAANRLPVVFVVDSTQRSSSRKHDGGDMSHWPFPTIAVDGRDVIAVYRVTKEAMTAARRGRGPTLVDGVNFLAPGGRGRDERDSLASFRGYLKRHSAWSEQWALDLETRLELELAGRAGIRRRGRRSFPRG